MPTSDGPYFSRARVSGRPEPDSPRSTRLWLTSRKCWEGLQLFPTYRRIGDRQRKRRADHWTATFNRMNALFIGHMPRPRTERLSSLIEACKNVDPCAVLTRAFTAFVSGHNQHPTARCLSSACEPQQTCLPSDGRRRPSQWLGVASPSSTTYLGRYAAPGPPGRCDAPASLAGRPGVRSRGSFDMQVC